MNTTPQKPTTSCQSSNRMADGPNLSLSATNRPVVMDSWFSPSATGSPPPRDNARIAPTFGRSPSSIKHSTATMDSRKLERGEEGSYFASKATLQALQSACEIAEEVMQLLGLEDSDEEEDSRDLNKGALQRQ